MALSDTNDFEQFITNRIDFTTGTPASGNTGDFEQFITNRIDLAEFTKLSGCVTTVTVTETATVIVVAQV